MRVFAGSELSGSELYGANCPGANLAVRLFRSEFPGANIWERIVLQSVIACALNRVAWREVATVAGPGD